LIVFLIKKWWFSDSVEQQTPDQQNTFEIFPDDSLALEHFVSLFFALMALIFFLLLTGELWVSLMMAGLFALRIDFVGSGVDEAEWKIVLDNESVLFDNEKRTARLLLAEVSQMKVYLAFNQPKKIVFKMNDGQLHQIKHYRRMDEILNHCVQTVPESKVNWTSYT
jgi:hypothetical protein